eukprot:4890720-Prymnesium_polylepis.1
MAVTPSVAAALQLKSSRVSSSRRRTARIRSEGARNTLIGIERSWKQARTRGSKHFRLVAPHRRLRARAHAKRQAPRRTACTISCCVRTVQTVVAGAVRCWFAMLVVAASGVSQHHIHITASLKKGSALSTVKWPETATGGRTPGAHARSLCPEGIDAPELMYAAQ